MKRAIILGSAAILIAVTAWLLLNREPPRKVFDKRFAGTTAISVVSYPKGQEGAPGTQRTQKLRPVQVKEILAEIDMRPKERCLCAHWTKLYFASPQGAITVSICNHCFDIVDDNKYETYVMPKPLWEKLEPIVAKLREQ